MINNFTNEVTAEIENTRGHEADPQVTSSSLVEIPNSILPNEEHRGSNDFLSKRDWQFIERAVLPTETGYVRYQAECWATCVLERMRHWQIKETARQENRDVIKACIAGSVFREFPGNKQWRARMEQLAKAGLMTKTACGKPSVATQYEVRVGPRPDSSKVRHVIAAIRKADLIFYRPFGVWVLAVGASVFDDRQLRDRYDSAGAGEIVRHRDLIDAIVSIERATSE